MNVCDDSAKLEWLLYKLSLYKSRSNFYRSPTVHILQLWMDKILYLNRHIGDNRRFSGKSGTRTSKALVGIKLRGSWIFTERISVGNTMLLKGYF